MLCSAITIIISARYRRHPCLIESPIFIGLGKTAQCTAFVLLICNVLRIGPNSV